MAIIVAMNLHPLNFLHSFIPALLHDRAECLPVPQDPSCPESCWMGMGVNHHHALTFRE